MTDIENISLLTPQSFIKRLLDIAISSIILLLLAFPLMIIAVMIRIKLGSPVFFKQVRPGLHSRPFKMIKFRTMTYEIDPNGELLSDASRLTRFGSFLRAASIDELPEFWNVLKGDMSLVGPRPLLMDYLPLYNRNQIRRHQVRPGITGWAQINGRNAISWEEKFALDIFYVDNRTLWLDIQILFFTVRKVLVRDSINYSGEATMPRFTGSKK
jgi:lipopolysaccharide/colanic/teichoic acid biosynthesis glycosyltransferase